MERKAINFQIKGMRRDMSISKADPNYAFEIINMRLTPVEGETTLSLVNEKGNSKILLATEDETPFVFANTAYIGHCVINEYLVLFTTRTVESLTYSTIYRIDFSVVTTIDNKPHYEIKTIFETTGEDKLNFSQDYPIETIGDFETEDIIKVYFTDGRNQPRVINIMKDYAHDDPGSPYNADELNFVRSLKLDDTKATITITKQESPGALFSSGVIQYLFTYYSRNAQESNIFYTSPIYYISPSSRGGAPDETIGNSFLINVTNPDSDFDYLRIYSLRRTSLDTVPIAKRVVDIPIQDSSHAINYIDNNLSGDEIDPSLLLYIGGDSFSAKTFDAKDNTLFLGNLAMLRHHPTYVNQQDEEVLFTTISNPFKDYGDAPNSSAWGTETKSIIVNTADPSVGYATYNYESTLGKSNKDITVFKTHEWYRLGFQLQHRNGVWTSAYWLKDIQINTVPTSDRTSTSFNNITFSIDDSLSSEIENLQSQGYIAIRPVIVYPKMSDRTVLCQGMVCPTVYNLKDRYDNTMYAQSSWFARPIPRTTTYMTGSNTGGSWVEFRHNHILHPIKGPEHYGEPTPDFYGNEIQSMDSGAVGDSLHNNKFWDGGGPSTTRKPSELYSDYYFVDNSIITLNTPELIFDESFILDEDSKYTFKVIGAFPINATTSDINILASSPFEGETCSVVYKSTGADSYSTGVVKLGALNKKFSLTNENGWKHSPVFPQWISKRVLDARDKVDGENNDYYNFIVAGMYISPWHKTGMIAPMQKRMQILNTHLAFLDPEYNSEILKNKKMSHLQFSNNSYYCNNLFWQVSSVPVATFNSEEVVSKRIRVPEYTYGKYYGNVDKLLVPGTDNGGLYKAWHTSKYYAFTAQQGFPNGTVRNMTTAPTENNDITTSYNSMLYNSAPDGSSFYLYYEYDVSDPISIKYKSTPHLVISLGKTPDGANVNDPTKTIIPYIAGTLSTVGNTNDPEYAHVNVANFALPDFFDDGGQGYLLLGEIWNDSITSTTRFGGQTEEALIANEWVVGGDAVPLENNFTLTWDRGDTYYQRFDCLKTYPFTLEDENSIVEVVSFMCETRVNIDGRYDRNRGTASLVAYPTNFNLFNPVYTQRDNFITYRGFNTQNVMENFPNQITWTLSKSPNAMVDRWTNLTMASTLNFDGDKGAINRIEKFKNDLYTFQDSGIAKILFNERTVLTTTSGAPVEIANSTRVEGKQYLTESEGLTNKLSIKVTPSGVYFIDGKTKTLYLFNGQQCMSLSDTKAMKTFFDGQEDNFRIFYDAKEKDVYFVNNNKCLCFSEKLGEFAGFFSYEGTPMMDNVLDKFISMYIGDGSLWENYTGEYNSFYDYIKGHSITFIGNDGVYADKIYTNLDFLSDSFLDGNYVTTKTFDRLKVWNEYQVGEYSLGNTLGHPSNLKKKFRVWRAQIPRANWNGRDRMRNPWCFVQLRMDNPSRYKTILHQTSLEYYV